MIHDVDESLRALVKRDALNGSGVDVAFDAPTKDWVARRNAPIVDLYLYDIREDLSRRDTAWVEVRDPDGRVSERRLPPRRYRLSYLVTAWTNRPEDEHRLLSALLSCFVRHEYVPAEILAGTLAGQDVPVLVTVALPPHDDRSIADTWSAMGGELKPSLDLVVTAPLDIARGIPAGPPVLEEPRLSVVRTEPGNHATPQVPAAAAPPPTAGRRRRRGAPAEDVTDSVAATVPPPGPIRAPATRPTDVEGVAGETFTAGAPSAPGRQIRVRRFAGR